MRCERTSSINFPNENAILNLRGARPTTPRRKGNDSEGRKKGDLGLERASGQKLCATQPRIDCSLAGRLIVRVS